MRNILKKYEMSGNATPSYHLVVDGKIEDELNEDEKELYQFIVGGMQAK
ncbi:hypothetical protein J2755_001073 [Methanohalophilus levihalophilus]|nr:hypothetical protein [Methanohalophilus levihalophilus]MBP2030139.1 hypothetical protein [Methanohalophilus levihalophilus]